MIREHGPQWDDGRPLREQEGWEAHAAFMERLVEEGTIVLGGPFGDGRRTLLLFEAASPQEIEARLADDPWPPEMLALVSIEPWDILLGRP